MQKQWINVEIRVDMRKHFFQNEKIQNTPNLETR